MSNEYVLGECESVGSFEQAEGNAEMPRGRASTEQGEWQVGAGAAGLQDKICNPRKQDRINTNNKMPSTSTRLTAKLGNLALWVVDVLPHVGR